MAGAIRCGVSLRHRKGCRNIERGRQKAERAEPSVSLSRWMLGKSQHQDQVGDSGAGPTFVDLIRFVDVTLVARRTRGIRGIGLRHLDVTLLVHKH